MSRVADRVTEQGKVTEIKEKYHLLHDGGAVYPQRDSGESLEAWRIRWQRWRDELFADNSLAEVEQVCVWLKNHATPGKRLNTHRTSYSWKHIVERDIDNYVSNGQLILAALLCGYRIQDKEYNPYINISLTPEAKAKLGLRF